MSNLIDQVVNGVIIGTAGHISGYVATASSNAVTVRATAYAPQGNNAQRSIRSTNVNDTSAGTGARTVKITYFDANCDGPFTETITLNGTGNVNTVSTNIALIEKMEVMTVGNGGGNAGTIQLQTAINGGGSTWASIATSDNRTYWAHHYVPNNKNCYIYKMRAGSTSLAGATTLQVLNPISSGAAQYNPIGTLRHTAPSNEIQFVVPVVIPGPAIIFGNTDPDAATAQTAYLAFEFIEI